MKTTIHRVARVWGPGILSVLGILIVGTTLFLGATWAQNAEAQDADPVVVQASEDAAAIDYAAAVDPDMDMDEARRRANLMEEARPILDSIREEAQKAPDTLAGFYLEHEPDLRVHLRLTAEPSSTLRSIIDKSPLPITVSTDAPATFSETRRRLDRAFPALQAAVPEPVGRWIDERTGEVVLDVFIEGDPEEAEEAKSRIEDAAYSLAQEMELPVRIDYQPAPGGLLATYGGTDLSGCTGGFTVEDVQTGEKGLATAGHCNDSQYYYGFGSDGNYSLDFEGEDFDNNSDVQWHTNNSHAVLPEFYADSTSSRRTVTSVTSYSSLMVGWNVCHRGETTGYSCGQVKSKNFVPPWGCGEGGGTTCDDVWVKVEGDYLACYPGDSGGPWFLSNSAYGIMNGGSWAGTGPGDCFYAVFMSQSFTYGVGVEVWVDN